MERQWEVVRSQRFELECASQQTEDEELTALLAAAVEHATWALSRDPYAGFTTANPKVRVITWPNASFGYAFSIFYSVNGPVVRLISIRVR